MEVSPLNNAAPASVKMARESSLKGKGDQLFNIIPRALRDISAGSPEQFKLKLDGWLSTVPDQPTLPGQSKLIA